MSQITTFSNYIKEKESNDYLPYIGSILFFFTGGFAVFLFIKELIKFEKIHYVQFDLLNLQFLYYLFLSTMLVQNLASTKEDWKENTIIYQFKFLITKKWDFNLILIFTLFGFHCFAFLQFFFLRVWIFGILRDTFLLIFISYLVYSTNNDEDAPSELIIYPLIIVSIIFIGSIIFNLIYFLYIEYSIVDQVNLMITVFPFMIIVLISLIVTYMLEKEKAKYLEFTRYEEEFAGSENRTNSMTEFIAYLPNNIAQLRIYLNVLYTIAGFGIVVTYFTFVYLGNTGFFRFVSIFLISFVLMTVSFVILIDKSRKRLFAIIEDYTKMITAFKERNQKILDLIEKS